MDVPKKADRKLAAFKLLGGKCSSKDCPLPDNGMKFDPCCFDFHHRDPNQKEFCLKSLSSKSWSRVLLELEKCNLLCAICHRLEHKNDHSLRKQRQKADIGEKTYYDRRSKGLSHDEALTIPLQPGQCWHPKDILTIDGITKSVKQWCKDRSINYHTFKSRTYLRGWPPEKALSTPPNRTTKITIGGESKTINEWCAKFDITIETYYRRLKTGLTPEEAIIRPKRPGKALN